MSVLTFMVHIPEISFQERQGDMATWYTLSIPQCIFCILYFFILYMYFIFCILDVLSIPQSIIMT